MRSPPLLGKQDIPRCRTGSGGDFLCTHARSCTHVQGDGQPRDSGRSPVRVPGSSVRACVPAVVRSDHLDTSLLVTH